jgi:hypothetical protein
MPIPRHWRVPAGANLTWRRWPDEEEYVFYHGASGDTYRLSELAGLILEQALTGPVGRADLMRWLQDQDVESPEATLEHVLVDLIRLDLLERADAAV